MEHAFIPYGRQNINEADIEAVVRVLKSDFITQGPAILAFEASIIAETKAQYAISMTSATAALHLACLALGLKAGDRLWTVPNTFVASANAGLYCGAQVDFVDIDDQDYLISIPALQQKLREAKAKNLLPKILIPVHFAGQSCDMKAIHKLSKEYGFKIIEDASHAIGASYLDGKVGDCCYSDICVFSFHPVKIVTTGEGGACTTNDPHLARLLQDLRSHGITRAPERLQHQDVGGWYYEQISLGYNYRMTDIQAALGASQMQRVAQFIEKRHELAQRYHLLLKDLPVKLPLQRPDGYSALHLYPICIDAQKTTRNRRSVFDHMRKNGIGVNVHYIPVHLQPYYAQFGFKSGDFPVAENYYNTCMSLPLFYDLSHNDQDRVVSTLRQAFA